MQFTELEYYHILDCKIRLFRGHRAILQDNILPCKFLFVRYSVTDTVDNMKGVLLLYNTSVSQQMKHKILFHHLIWDYVQYVTVKILFFHSEENLENIFTKDFNNIPYQLLTA